MMAHPSTLVAGLLMLASGQADETASSSGFLSKDILFESDASKTSYGDYDKFMATRFKHVGSQPARTQAQSQDSLQISDELDKEAMQKLLAQNSKMPKGLSAIGVALLSFAAMLGVRFRRGTQPATALAGSSAQVSDMAMPLASSPSDNIVELKQGSTTKAPLEYVSQRSLSTPQKDNFGIRGWSQSSQSSHPMTACYATQPGISAQDARSTTSDYLSTLGEQMPAKLRIETDGELMPAKLRIETDGDVRNHAFFVKAVHKKFGTDTVNLLQKLRARVKAEAAKSEGEDQVNMTKLRNSLREMTGDKAPTVYSYPKSGVLGKVSASVLVAFWLGWYDVLCISTFRNMMTKWSGNLMKVGVSAGAPGHADLNFALNYALTFFGGHTLYKCINIKFSGRRFLGTFMAPLIFAMHVVCDNYRAVFPNGNQAAYLLAAATGMTNGVSADLYKVIPYAYTGHLMNFSRQIAEMLMVRGSGRRKKWMKAMTGENARMMYGFIGGAAASQALPPLVPAAIRNLSLAGMPATTFWDKHKFGFMGAIVGAIWTLSELPLRTSKKNVDEVLDDAAARGLVQSRS
jgi:uncharacterized membrane protein YoaK (UPF0700 family)